MKQFVFIIANKIRLMMTIKKSLPGAFKWSPRTNPECWGRWGETDGIFNHSWTCTSLQECSVSFFFRSVIDKLSWKKKAIGVSQDILEFSGKGRWQRQIRKENFCLSSVSPPFSPMLSRALLSIYTDRNIRFY